jgi:hypothetical protein
MTAMIHFKQGIWISVVSGCSTYTAAIANLRRVEEQRLLGQVGATTEDVLSQLCEMALGVLQICEMALGVLQISAGAPT